MTNQTDDIDQLNSFLRGELSAVETYNQAIEKFSDELSVRSALEQNKSSHSERVTKLQSEVRRLGGEPSTDSGVWGAFAKLVEGSAKAFGKSAAIAALEEGEDHGINDYQRDRDELTPGVRQFVDQSIVPEQRKTHASLSHLKTQV